MQNSYTIFSMVSENKLWNSTFIHEKKRKSLEINFGRELIQIKVYVENLNQTSYLFIFPFIPEVKQGFAL